MNKTVLAGMLLGLAYAGSANATLITSISPTGAAAGQTYATLNSLAAGSSSGTFASGITLTSTGPSAGVVNGSLPNSYAAPFFSNGNGLAFGDANGVDTTNYVRVGVNSSSTLTFTGSEQYIGLLWGSVDAYNTLTFFGGTNGTGTNVGSLSGNSILANANGSQGASGTVYVNINSTQAFRSIVLTSTVNAFELDNIAFGPSQVPEPISIALLGSGLVGMGVFRRRRAK